MKKLCFKKQIYFNKKKRLKKFKISLKQKVIFKSKLKKKTNSKNETQNIIIDPKKAVKLILSYLLQIFRQNTSDYKLEYD